MCKYIYIYIYIYEGILAKVIIVKDFEVVYI